jgi:predicted nuclease of predicted toxin-antitoxin system
MSLRFLTDQCVPREMTNLLSNAKFDVRLLRDVLPIRSLDPVVIQKAQELDAILFSLNGDFSDIVTYPPSQFGGIIAAQLHNHPEIIPSLMQRLVSFLTTNPDRNFYRGKLLIVEVHRIRIRE